MGEEHRESSGSAALLVGALVAVVLLFVCGGLVVVGVGSFVYVRSEVNSLPPPAMDAPLLPAELAPPPPPVTVPELESPKGVAPGSEAAPESKADGESPPIGGTTSEAKP